MEINKYYTPAEIDYIQQIKDRIPGHIAVIDAGHMAVRATIKVVNKEKRRVTYRINGEDAEKLQEAIESNMSRRHR